MKTHILEDEAASRAYISQVWAEAMEIYRSGRWKLTFSPEMVRYLKEYQRDFMPEDTKAGMIQAFLDSYPGDTVGRQRIDKVRLSDAKAWLIKLQKVDGRGYSSIVFTNFAGTNMRKYETI